MAAQDVVYIFNTGVLIMNHFDITENISTTDQILRTFAGTLLLLTAITATIPDVHPSVFPKHCSLPCANGDYEMGSGRLCY